MKKGQIAEGFVTELVFPNKGIASAEDGSEVVVKHTLPGQKVSFAVQKARRGKYEGRLLEVLEKSPIELAEPACRHFGICGGCTYQNVAYETQLKLKEEQVRKLLSPVLADGGMDFDALFEGIKKSPREQSYRNKMEYSFGDEHKDGPLALGMHKRGSFYDIANVDGCRITDSDFGRILACARDFFGEQGVSFYHKMRHEGYLRHLLVRKAAKTGEILVDLVTSTQTQGLEEPALLHEMKERMIRLSLDGKIVGILHTRNDSLADVIQDDGTDILFGQDYFYEELLGLRFMITPFSFFQTNSLGAEVLYQTVREYIEDVMQAFGERNGTVFDLYSGTGTIAQLLSDSADKVVGVEIVAEAVAAARENARRNGLSNCEFIAGDVLKVLDTVEEEPDFIVLDPPRDGIHPKALKKIISYGVERMVYISCKPTSLARDLVLLQGAGYAVERLCCVDMFPFTGNVESIALLSKLKSTKMKHINVELEMDELDLTAAESKAAYAELKQYVLDKYGLKVSSLNIAQIKAKCGIVEHENYNKAKNENVKQPNCTEEKENAIKDAFKHFQMI